MEQHELMRAILARLNEITGKNGAAAPESLETAVFQRLDQAGKIIGAIQQYLPKRVIDKILLNPDGVKVEGERRPVTVLFGDLSGFTAMSETMDPEQVVEVVNQYFDTMVEIAERYGGHIDKFMGDALMVLFGAPVVHEDDALRACLAAVEMLEAMDRFSAERKMDLAMSIGLNSGEVVALNVGSKGRMEYTVIGDGVNLAARLEKVATARQCVIGENTYKQVKGKIRLQKLKPVMVKGKSKAQNVYLILGRVETAETAAGLRAGSIPMVGRMAELDTVRESIAAVKGGTGRVVAITGEPGLGKSRLAKELELLARDEGFAFCKGKCYSYTQSVAYLPFLRQLQLLLGVQDKDTNEKKGERLRETLQGLDLSEFEPFLGSLLGLAYPEIADLDPQKRKRKTFEGFISLFRKLAAKRPLAVAFEDLQWADSLSLELLEHLVEGLANAPILVCCDYRPELALPFIAKPYCRSIVLNRLDEREVLQMMTGLANVGDVADPVLKKVAERTEGNPLFIEEITRHLLARRLVKRDGTNLVPAKRFGAMALPGTVAGVVLGRIDKLSEELRRTLQYAAVVGREFDRETLAHITKTAPEQLQQQLENMEHYEGLLYSKEAEGKRLYQFHSTATQEAAYGTLLKQRRRDLHGRVAQTYERDYHGNLEPWLEDLAHHYYLSAFEDKAVVYLRKAGDKARGLYANGEAIEFYDKGIGVLKKAKGSKENASEMAELLAAQGFILRLIGQREQAQKNFANAIRLSQRNHDSRAARKYLISLGVIKNIMGNSRDALTTWQQVLDDATKAGDRQYQAMALNNIGSSLLRSGSVDKAIENFDRALAIYVTSDEQRELARTHSNLAKAQEIKQNLPAAIEHYQRALEIARSINYQEGIALFSNNVGIVYLMMQDIGQARDNFFVANVIASRIGDAGTVALATGNIGIIEAMAGNFDVAFESFTKSLAAAGEIHDRQQGMQMLNNIGCIHQIWGGLAQAIEQHLVALKVAEEIEDVGNECDIRRNLGIDYLWSGRFRESRQQFDRAQQLAAQMGDPRMSAYLKANRGALDHQLGLLEQSGQECGEALKEAAAVGDPEVILAAARTAIELAIDQGDHEQAGAYLRKALGLAEKSQNRREHAYALLNLADLMLRAQDLDGMAAPMSEALTEARELKDKILLGRIYLLAAQKALVVGNIKEVDDYIADVQETVVATGAPELAWQAAYFRSRSAAAKQDSELAGRELEQARKLIREMASEIPDDARRTYIERTGRQRGFAP